MLARRIPWSHSLPFLPSPILPLLCLKVHSVLFLSPPPLLLSPSSLSLLPPPSLRPFSFSIIFNYLPLSLCPPLPSPIPALPQHPLLFDVSFPPWAQVTETHRDVLNSRGCVREAVFTGCLAGGLSFLGRTPKGQMYIHAGYLFALRKHMGSVT